MNWEDESLVNSAGFINISLQQYQPNAQEFIVHFTDQHQHL